MHPPSCMLVTVTQVTLSHCHAVTHTHTHTHTHIRTRSTTLLSTHNDWLPLVRLSQNCSSHTGGNSADRYCFGFQGTDVPAGCPPTNPNMSDLNSYRAFAEGAAAAANVSYVMDINFGLTPDPSVVATPHIRAITEAGLWPWVRGVEIGNGEKQSSVILFHW